MTESIEIETICPTCIGTGKETDGSDCKKCLGQGKTLTPEGRMLIAYIRQNIRLSEN